MHHLFIGAVVLGVISSAALGDGTSTSQPSTVDNRWSASFFQYQPPARLVVEETTPTMDQINFHQRAQQMAIDPPDPVSTGPARPMIIDGMRIVRLEFRDVDGQVVPALLCKPKEGKGPFPVVIAVHGLNSNKAEVCAQIAPSLTRAGFAVLAADLPFHGERPGAPISMIDPLHPVKTFAAQKEAIIDVRQCIDIAQSRSDLDTANGVVFAGYSLGCWVGSVSGAVDERIKAMALMVGGALDVSPQALQIPMVAAVDPRLALPHFAGRPLLMLNGKQDPVVTPEMSRRLYAAAADPKQQKWYDSGHLLPVQAYDDAATWISDTWKQLSAANAAKKQAGKSASS